MPANVSGDKWLALSRRHAVAAQVQEYLGNRSFVLVLALAFLLHASALLIWQFMPHPPVLDIPVHALNIKLGDGDMEPEYTPPPTPVAAAPDTAHVLSQLMSDMTSHATPVLHQPQVPVAQTPSQAVPARAVSPAPPMQPVRHFTDSPRQFVREAATAPPAVGNGSSIGNSAASQAEMIAHYEQTLSLWIQKFKTYPDDARAHSMQGRTVVRIRIDRQGNIRYFILEQSTGYQTLDRAALDMIQRANPVPPVPNDYPPGDLMEFLIPVNFNLQQ